MKRILLFCVVLLITTPAFAFDTWLFTESFFPGFKSWGHNVVTKPHPVRYGKESERFEVRAGDCGWNNNHTWNDCDNDRERHELTSHGIGTHNPSAGDLFWYRFSLYLPKSNPDIRGIDTNYAQLYLTPNCSPAFQIVHSYPLGVWVKGIGYEKYNSTIIPEKDVKGKWHDIVINVLWEPHDFGYIQVFLNGGIKQTHFGPTMTFDCQGVYFKYGIYRHHMTKEDNTPTTVAYFDGLRRARSEDGMFMDLDE